MSGEHQPPNSQALAFPVVIPAGNLRFVFAFPFEVHPNSEGPGFNRAIKPLEKRGFSPGPFTPASNKQNFSHPHTLRVAHSSRGPWRDEWETPTAQLTRPCFSFCHPRRGSASVVVVVVAVAVAVAFVVALALAFLSVILAGDLLLPSRLPIPKLKASGKQRAPTATFPFEKSRNDQPPACQDFVSYLFI